MCIRQVVGLKKSNTPRLPLSVFFFINVLMSSNGLEYGYGINGTTVNAGSQSNPYAINDFVDLQTISSSNWGTGVYYQQTADITLTASMTKTSMLGSYNGNGYTIDGNSQYNVVITGNSSTECTLKNTTIVNWKYTPGNGIFQEITCTNCMFDGTSVTNTQLGLSIFGAHSNSGIITNCISIDTVCSGGHAYDTRNSATFVGQYGSSYTNTYTIQNCVAINGSVTGSSGNYRIAYPSSNTLLNNYATNGGDSTSGANGLSITSTEYNSQSWWENTALYDFSSTGAWEWDSTTNLPKLKHTPYLNIYTDAWVNGKPYVYNTEWLQGEKLHVYTSSGWTEKV